MIPTSVRFRCPRCQANLTASASRSGSPIVCPACFGPMVVPDPAADPGGSPIALAIEVPPAPGPEQPAPEAAPLGFAPPEVAPADLGPGLAGFRTPIPAGPIAGMPEFADPPAPDEVEMGWVGPVVCEEPRPPEATGLWAGLKWSAGVAALGLIAAVALVAALDWPRDDSRRAGRPAARPVAPAPVVKAVARPAPVVANDPAPPAPRPAQAPPPAEPAETVEARRQQADREALHAEQAARAKLAARARLAAREEQAARRAEPPPGEPARFIVSRRGAADQETLREELAAVPELRLDPRLVERLKFEPHQAPSPILPAFGPDFFVPQPVARRRAHHAPKAAPAPEPLLPRAHARPPELIARMQPELAALPWRMGHECLLAQDPAEELQMRSRALRTSLHGVGLVGDSRLAAEGLRATLGVGDAGANPLARRLRARNPLDLSWIDPAAIPALMQLLMAEPMRTREVLVEVLARIQGPRATSALAKLALFDLAPQVRDRAAQALQGRPAEEYRPILLEGFRYPWPPAADHAAEALVALDDRAAVPELTKLLDEPDPRGPLRGLHKDKTFALVRTLVRVNHLRNCLLCHAASTSPTTDLVRGRIPTEGQPLPPPNEYYGDRRPGLFVRAEVTYLRQDFSVTQPVEDADPWPTQQRYDYLVAERPATPEECEQAHARKPSGSYPQREAVQFALHELAGRDDPAPDKGGPAN